MDNLDGPGFFRSRAQVRADFAHGSLESGILRRLIPSGKHLLQFHKEVARVLCGMGIHPGQNALPFTGERVGAAASPIEKRRTRVCVFAQALCVGCWISFRVGSWLRFGETLLNRKAQRQERGRVGVGGSGGHGNSKKQLNPRQQRKAPFMNGAFLCCRGFEVTVLPLCCDFCKKPLASGRHASSTIIDGTGNEFKDASRSPPCFHQERSYSPPRGEAILCLIQNRREEQCHLPSSPSSYRQKPCHFLTAG